MGNKKNKKPGPSFPDAIISDYTNGFISHDFRIHIHKSDLGHLYSIKEALGNGISGTVFLAERMATNKNGTLEKTTPPLKVAIKLIDSPLGEEDPDIIREIDFLKQTNQYLDQGAFPDSEVQDGQGNTHSGRKFAIIMKYFPGSTLEETLYEFDQELKSKNLNYHISKKNISIRDKLQITLGLINSFITLHDKAICHRDLKPANIICNTIQDKYHRRTDVNIIDLGSAAKSQAPPASKEFSRSFSSPSELNIQSELNNSDYESELIKENKSLDHITKELSQVSLEDKQIKALRAAKGYCAPEMLSLPPPEHYNYSMDLYALGVLIAEIWSAENYQKKLNTFLYLVESLVRDTNSITPYDFLRLAFEITSKNQFENSPPYQEMFATEQNEQFDNLLSSKTLSKHIREKIFRNSSNVTSTYDFIKEIIKLIPTAVYEINSQPEPLESEKPRIYLETDTISASLCKKLLDKTNVLYNPTFKKVYEAIKHTADSIKLDDTIEPHLPYELVQDFLDDIFFPNDEKRQPFYLTQCNVEDLETVTTNRTPEQSLPIDTKAHASQEMFSQLEIGNTPKQEPPLSPKDNQSTPDNDNKNDIHEEIQIDKILEKTLQTTINKSCVQLCNKNAHLRINHDSLKKTYVELTKINEQLTSRNPICEDDCASPIPPLSLSYPISPSNKGGQRKGSAPSILSELNLKSLKKLTRLGSSPREEEFSGHKKEKSHSADNTPKGGIASIKTPPSGHKKEKSRSADNTPKAGIASIKTPLADEPPQQFAYKKKGKPLLRHFRSSDGIHPKNKKEHTSKTYPLKECRSIEGPLADYKDSALPIMPQGKMVMFSSQNPLTPTCNSLFKNGNNEGPKKCHSQPIFQLEKKQLQENIQTIHENLSKVIQQLEASNIDKAINVFNECCKPRIPHTSSPLNTSTAIQTAIATSDNTSTINEAIQQAGRCLDDLRELEGFKSEIITGKLNERSSITPEQPESNYQNLLKNTIQAIKDCQKSLQSVIDVHVLASTNPYKVRR